MQGGKIYARASEKIFRRVATIPGFAMDENGKGPVRVDDSTGSAIFTQCEKELIINR